LDIKFQEKNSSNVDDVKGILISHFPEAAIHHPMTNIDEFVKVKLCSLVTEILGGGIRKREIYSSWYVIAYSAHSIGDQVHSYSLPSDSDVTYEVYGVKIPLSYFILQGTFADQKMRAYHQRIRLFVKWFIDASSFIEDEDFNWEIYFT
jgi:hypothetical protein